MPMGRKGEESRLVALIIIFVIFVFLSKLVLACIFM